jgi:hypothetical protein
LFGASVMSPGVNVLPIHIACRPILFHYSMPNLRFTLMRAVPEPDTESAPIDNHALTTAHQEEGGAKHAVPEVKDLGWKPLQCRS